MVQYAVYKSNLTPVHEIIYNAPHDELQILARGLCEELEQLLAQSGEVCVSEAALETAYNALRKEFDATKAELGATKAELGATKAKLDDTKAELGTAKAQLGTAKARAYSMGELAVETRRSLNKEVREHAQLRKRSLVIENKLRDAKAKLGATKAKLGASKAQLVAAAVAASRPRRRSPRLVEVAAKKAAKA